MNRHSFALVGSLLLAVPFLLGLSDFRGGPSELALILGFMYVPFILAFLIGGSATIIGLVYAIWVRQSRPWRSRIVGGICGLLLVAGIAILAWMITEGKIHQRNTAVYLTQEEARAAGEPVHPVTLTPERFVWNEISYEYRRGWVAGETRHENRVLSTRQVQTGRSYLHLVFTSPRRQDPGPHLVRDADDPAAWVNTPAYRGPSLDHQGLLLHRDPVPEENEVIVRFELPAGYSFPATIHLLDVHGETVAAAVPPLLVERAP